MGKFSNFHKKHKVIIFIIIITIVLILVQTYISKKILETQNELDDLNQADSNFNLMYSIMNVLDVSKDYESAPLSNLKNVINPVDKWTFDLNEEPDRAPLISSKKSTIMWLNVLNGFIITLEMFAVGLLTTIILVNKDSPLFITERVQIGDREVTVVKAFPKYKLRDAVSYISTQANVAKAFKSERPGLKYVVSNLFTKNNDNAIHIDDRQDTPREPPSPTKRNRKEIPTIDENLSEW
jgi:hypothetical protein